jgi:hypothetical protein
MPGMIMESIAIVLLVAILALLVYNAFFKPTTLPTQDEQSLLLMQQQLQTLAETVDRKLSENSKAVQEGSQLQSLQA